MLHDIQASRHNAYNFILFSSFQDNSDIISTFLFVKYEVILEYFCISETEIRIYIQYLLLK